MIARRPPQKSSSETTVLVTLHREPPLTRILAPGFGDPSSRTTFSEGFRRRVKIAAAMPAAPAPTIAMSQEEGRFSPPTRYYAALGFVETTVECAPHALQRMISVFPSSRRPITWVRWLPHLRQSCGGH
jgi:hypothetical protein